MYLRLARLQQVGEGTTGVLKVDGQPNCETMENSHRMIATGMYPVRLTMSEKFGIVLPLIDRVIGRTDIRIHPGNTPADTEGCILVGEVTGSHLINSKKTFVNLMSLLMTAQHQHEEIWIDIVDELPETLLQHHYYDLATRYGTPDSYDHVRVITKDDNPNDDDLLEE